MKRDLSGYIFRLLGQWRTAPGNAHIFFSHFQAIVHDRPAWQCAQECDDIPDHGRSAAAM